MKCSKCNTEVPDGVKFCPNCGNSFAEETTQEQPAEQPIQQPVEQPVEQPIQPEPQPVEKPVESVPQSTFQPVSGVSTEKPKKKSKKGLVLFVVLILLIAALVGGGWFYYTKVYSSPTSFFKKAISKGMETINDVADKQKIESFSATLSLDANIKLNKDLINNMGIDEDLLDLVNDLDGSVTVEADKKNETVVLKVNSTYKKDSLINGEAYMDAKNEKMYLYCKDFYDKYIELDEGDVDYSELDIEGLFDAVNELSKLSVDTQKVNKILSEELQSMVKDKYCSKESSGLDNTFTIKMTIGQFAKEMSVVFDNLSNNKEFMKCFEDSEEVKSGLKEASKKLSTVDEKNDSATIKIIVETKGVSQEVIATTVELAFGKTIIKVKIEVEDKNTIKYTAAINGQKLFTATVKTIENGKNDYTYEITISSSEIGSASIKIGVKYELNGEISTINGKKVEKIKDMSESDAEKIVEKFQKSKLYDFIESIAGTMGISSDTPTVYDWELYDGEDDNTITTNTNADLKENEVISYDGKTKVEFKIPDGYKSNYSSNSYKTFVKDTNNKITVKLNYGNTSGFEKSMESIKKSYDQLSSFKNIKMSDVKEIEVNGRKYKYAVLEYTYEGFSKIDYKIAYIGGDIEGSNYMFEVEVETDEKDISEEILKQVLDIKIVK